MSQTEGMGKTMPVKLSPKGAAWPILEGLELLGRGKVRDSYRLADGQRLIVATDRISALDYVLNPLIPKKGICLNVAAVFWFKYLEQFGIRHHMVGYGAGIDRFLPGNLRGDVDLQSRAMVVHDLQMCNAEFVLRACLTGSALKPYMENGIVCGHKLPPGLQDGDELPCILFTPTTKAQEGHDEHVPAEEIIRLYPLESQLVMQIFMLAYKYARSRGIVLADTKFEIGQGGWATYGVLADEVLTPDSSRYWPYNVWSAGRKEEKRKAPPSFDKEPIRTWLKAQIAEWVQKHPEFKKFDPEIPECVDVVHGFEMPESLIEQTTQGYLYIDWRLMGKTVDRFRIEDMGIQLPKPEPKNVLIICGSEHDLPVVNEAIANGPNGVIIKHVMSCHRNPLELMDFVKELGNEDVCPDVVIGVGGKALALPGIIDAWAYCYKRNIQVAGVALGEPGSKSLLAAQLSIEEIPDQPVIINEMTGQAYSGASGLRELLDRISNGELPPQKSRIKRSVQMHV